MCCERCSFYPCPAAVTVRIHAPRHGGMPENHYHLCKSYVPCGCDCDRCGKLVNEMAHMPSAHFSLGCCRRCPEYKGCNDFVARHLINLVHPAAAPHAVHGLRPNW